MQPGNWNDVKQTRSVAKDSEKRKMKKDYVEALTQVLYSHPDETIDAVTEYFDEAFDYILETFDRPTRHTLLAEEMVSLLQHSSFDSPTIDMIIAIFRLHGIDAGRLVHRFASTGREECFHNYVTLGPIYVSMGDGQQRKEDEDVLIAAESLCFIRLTALRMT